MTEQTSDLLSAVHELRQRAELSALDVIECHAIRHLPDTPAGFTTNLESGIAPFEEGLIFRFELVVNLTTGEGGQDVAEVRAMIGSAYTMEDPPDATGPVAGLFAAEVAFKDAYPYLRQNIHELALRVGLGGVMLNTLAVPPTYKIPAHAE